MLKKGLPVLSFFCSFIYEVNDGGNSNQLKMATRVYRKTVVAKKYEGGKESLGKVFRWQNKMSFSKKKLNSLA
ncbi:hypothetical protein TNCT_284391 [Trichonephila clavata]|uniref:Uncharacterized protein n=1 Tax=Trichonephila clavata TaxID=2740835 RepID=A0A8X6IYY5_TRICU|nr:hypothetical protein TNCT_284391 [Trichonephila clavata]